MHGNFPHDRLKLPAIASPVGPGEITNVSMAGHPEVNGVAVAWLEQEDGFMFDPFGLRKIALLAAERAKG